MKYHKLSGLKKTQKINSSEARSLKSKYQQGLAVSEGATENLFHGFLLVSGAAGIPWNFLAYKCIIPISASMVTQCSPCVYVSLLFL